MIEHPVKGRGAEYDIQTGGQRVSTETRAHEAHTIAELEHPGIIRSHGLGRSPAGGYFLALDWVNIAVFGALVYTAVRNRHRTDWHRRLMLCATVCVIAPALGRLIVLSGSAMTATLNVAFLLLYVLVGMLFDWGNRGRVHPAYFWGAAALIVFAVGTELLAILPPFAALAASIAS